MCIRDSLDTARRLLSPQFGAALRPHLNAGLSFPAARSRALASLGGDPGVLERPNDILAVEYCKAILARGSRLVPLPIDRPGDYHALEAHRENPSATSLRPVSYTHLDVYKRQLPWRPDPCRR